MFIRPDSILRPNNYQLFLFSLHLPSWSCDWDGSLVSGDFFGPAGFWFVVACCVLCYCFAFYWGLYWGFAVLSPPVWAFCHTHLRRPLSRQFHWNCILGTDGRMRTVVMLGWAVGVLCGSFWGLWSGIWNPLAAPVERPVLSTRPQSCLQI